MKASSNTLPIGLMADRNGQATFVSKGWVRHTGRTIDETLGKGWLADIHPDDRDRVDFMFSNPPVKRKPVQFTFRLKHFVGGYSNAAACASPSLANSGEFAGWSIWVSPADGGDPANPIFELISNNMREIVCLLSDDARILYISPAVQTILGYNPDEIIGQVFPPSIIPVEQRSDFKKLYASFEEIEGPQYTEICLPSRSGEPVWLEMDLQFVRDERGAIINLQIVARDVTLRKQHEEMLQMQNEIAGILWETTDTNSSLNEVLKVFLTVKGVDCGGIYITDPKSHDLNLICHSRLSPAYVDAISHYPADHPLTQLCKKGEPIIAYFPDLVEQTRPEPIDIYKNENLLGFAAFPIVYKQQLIAVSNLASHTLPEIPLSSRQTLEFLSRQIGALIARNRAERALRESEQKFRSFFEQSTDMISLVDEKGAIIEWNPTSEVLTGLSKDEVVGRRGVDVQFDLLPPEKKTALAYKKMQARFASIQRSGKGSFLNNILEGQILDKSGQLRSFQQVIFPIETDKGFMLGSAGRDVTHLKMIEEAEEEQRKLTEALIDSAAVLNSSLVLDDIIKSIFVLVEKVVPNQGGALMLANPETGLMRVAGNLGSKKRSPGNFENKLEFSFHSVPVLKKLADTRRPLIIPDTRTSKLWKNFHSDQPTGSFLGIPICRQKEVIGFLTLTHASTDFFQPKHADWLMAFANQAAMAIDNARLFGQVERLAVLDELTHIYNRRGLMEQGEREVARALRFGRPLSALFLDVDRFKDINDAYSHAAGDLVLQSVASCFYSLMRSVDVIGRYGGEEFVILLPETNVKDARQIANRLRSVIEETMIEIPQGKLNTTVSIGVASLDAGTRTLENLLEKADAAVHRAKAGGRNRVEVG